MKIGIELNGVLRNTLNKIEQVYDKFYINNPFEEKESSEYEIISPLTTLNIMDHLYFKNEDELYEFLYKEHTMEIFGHAPSTEMTSFNDFNEFYYDFRDEHDILIVSDEIGKSKPASLFFVSKFGCLVETVKFYSETTINLLWDSVDVLLTANPKLLLNHPNNKIVIKYETSYNQDINVEYSISSLKDLKNKIKEIYVKSIE
jgi:hypothetical protein